MVKIYDDWYCVDTTWLDGFEIKQTNLNLNKSYETFKNATDSEAHTVHTKLEAYGMKLPSCVRDNVVGEPELVTGEINGFQIENGVLYSKDKKTLVCYPKAKQGAYVVPDGTKKIADRAFLYNRGVTSLQLPEGLEAVYLPAGITYVGPNVFEDCIALTDVYFAGTEEQWNALDVSNAQIPDDCEIHFGAY